MSEGGVAPSMSRFPSMTRGALAAVLALIVFLACILLEPIAPWLTTFPEWMTLPATEWVGAGLEVVLEAIKPVMRLFSWLLGFPMSWANWLFSVTPWPLVIGVTAALGWRAGGFWMASLSAVGLGFVLLSGYWAESMNTLSLVAVSVPLAIVVGGGIGIWANEAPRLKSVLTMVLDVMQTVPTFAYLTPLLLLFGFGPVVGLIASAIYAAPPMARNTILGLERVESEVKEAAVMSGGTRLQQLFLVEIPSASRQIMVGVNQCLMASLSMVIIAAVIGGFDDIGWEVLLTMRKAQFGQALLAGLVIVVFAMIIDRISAAFAAEGGGYDRRASWSLLGAGGLGAMVVWLGLGPAAGEFSTLVPVAEWIDAALSDFVVSNGPSLDSFKNNAMFFGLLPLRIGLDDAVLPFTWGVQWTRAMSLLFIGAAALIGGGIALFGRPAMGATFVILALVLETGVSQLPWLAALVSVGALAWVAGGARLAVFCIVLLGTILVSGLWERALMSVYLSGAAVLACVVVGGVIGLVCAWSEWAWRVVRPICDMLQTIPLFVFLIPVLMLFQIGEFSAFLAICAYAIVPMIRYTRHGLVSTPSEMLEAAVASGATPWQIMRDVRAPYAAPTVLLGLNQTILYAFAMLVIAALIGTTGLGQSIYLALGQADVGLGVSAGAAMAILALIADRLVQGFAEERRRALGL